MQEPHNSGMLFRIFQTWKIFLIPDDKSSDGRKQSAKALGFESMYTPLVLRILSLFIALAIILPNFPYPRSWFRLVVFMLLTYLLASIIAVALTFIQGKGFQLRGLDSSKNDPDQGPPA
jgi:hypothetical protein